MKVVSVKFKENGRAYYFDPGEFKIKEGDFVVVTTARGTECGEVVRAAHEVPGFSREVKPVIRVADAVDVRRMRQNRADVQQAYHICEQRIAAHNLKMKLVDAEYTLDRRFPFPVRLFLARASAFKIFAAPTGVSPPHCSCP